MRDLAQWSLMEGAALSTTSALESVMEVRAIMSCPPVSVDPDASLDEVMDLMDQCDVRHLPVEKDGKLLGVISDRDLLRATGWLPARLRDLTQDPKHARHVSVRELLHTPVMTVTPDDSVVTVAVESVVQKIGCLPVVEGDKVVGMVTELDLMAAFISACRGSGGSDHIDAPVDRYMSRSVRAIDSHVTLGQARRTMTELGVRHLPVVTAGRLLGLVSDRDLRRAEGVGRPDDFPIDEIMTTDVRTVSPSAPLSKAVAQMVEAKISSLPVLQDDELVGILTSTDVLDHCMNHLRRQEGWTRA